MNLSEWEIFVLNMGLSFLTMLMAKLKNTVEIAACQAAIAFLQNLLNGSVGSSTS